MAGIADALAATGSIPPVDASTLQPPSGQPKTAPGDKSKDPSGMMGQYAKDEEKVETARSERDTAETGIPKYPTLAPEPKPDEPNPMKGYTAVIGVLGAIGSMFTRRPMTNTMNAAAASLQAMNSKEATDFDDKYKIWKTQNDNAFKLLDYQNKIYDTVLKNKTTSVDERISEMQAHAAMFKDDYMMQLAKDKNLMEMEELQLKRQDAGQKAGEYAEKIQGLKDKRDTMAQWVKENPNAKAIDKAAAYNQVMEGKAPPKVTGGVTYTPQAIDANARALLSGLTPSALGLSRNSPNLAAAQNRAIEMNPDFNPAEAELDYKAGSKALGSLETRASNIDLAADSLDKAIPLVRDALKKLDMSPSTDVNTVMNFMREHSSDPAFAAYNLSLITAFSDYAALSNRGAPMTVSAKETAAEAMANNMGDMAMGAVLDQMNLEKVAQKKAIKEAVDEQKQVTMNKTSGSSEPAQEDLEFTAKKYGITVDEVKKRLKEQ